MEADILSHEERISDMNEQADALMKSEQFDTQDIDNKRSKLNEHFAKVKELATNRQSRLTEANTLHNFFRYYLQIAINYLSITYLFLTTYELVLNTFFYVFTNFLGTLLMKNLGSKKRNYWLDLMIMAEI